MWKRRIAPLYSVLLPILGGAYPVIFLYSHNVKIISLDSLDIPLLATTLLALVLFGLFYLFQRSRMKAGLSAFVFLIFFHLYGLIYSKLLVLNIVQTEHYTLLPLMVMAALYIAFFISKLGSGTASRLQSIFLLVAGALILVNVAPVIPAEIDKAKASAPMPSPQVKGTAMENAPDIYFIIFDEYAGFEALHEYWKYDGYKPFISFLEKNNFYVADKSHGYYPDTLYELSMRLNLRLNKNLTPPLERPSSAYKKLFDSIADNKVMRLLKSYGYTTVVFDGPRIPYKTKTEMVADYNFMYEGDAQVMGSDEFVNLLLDQTMVRAFSFLYQKTSLPTDRERNMILFTLEKATHLEDIPTPKFVYIHVMLPHMPIIFDENGYAVDYNQRVNWNLYLGQHKYATKRAEQLVSGILKSADPKRPPIIILQSDHGARNLPSESPDAVPLENYDDKYKTSIMNAVLLPGYDYSTLTRDLSPLEPLKIVLNYYFHAGVEIENFSEQY